MFKLFNKTAISKADKTVNEIIEEIHESFYTEVDKLLAEAKIMNSTESEKEDLLKKAERLRALGFNRTKEANEAALEESRLRFLKAENIDKERLAATINYFSRKYPQYKFITEESVRKICEKYNLVYGEVERYTGTVPDKNLAHIENFKIDENDECWTHKVIMSGFRGTQTVTTSFGSFADMKAKETFGIPEPPPSASHEERLEYANLRYHELWENSVRGFRETNTKCSLEIAAPIKDFNMEGMEVKGSKLSKIEIPDPIVLKPVFHNGKKHYLIVTAWGLEASDELVVNANHN